MDDILERLLRQYPEAAPILRSKYIPDCHVGRGRVWRAGRPVVTDTYRLYPPGGALAQVYSRLAGQQEGRGGGGELTWSAR